MYVCIYVYDRYVFMCVYMYVKGKTVSSRNAKHNSLRTKKVQANSNLSFLD